MAQQLNFERYISRNFANWLSNELDLAGMKISVNMLIQRAMKVVRIVSTAIPMLGSMTPKSM